MRSLQVDAEPQRIDWSEDWLRFKVGDHVSRDGSDVHRIEYLSEDNFSGDFRCLVAPASGWCAVGDVEPNLTRRYRRVVLNLD